MSPASAAERLGLPTNIMVSLAALLPDENEVLPSCEPGALLEADVVC